MRSSLTVNNAVFTVWHYDVVSDAGEQISAFAQSHDYVECQVLDLWRVRTRYNYSPLAIAANVLIPEPCSHLSTLPRTSHLCI